jgi:hypothetical protein
VAHRLVEHSNCGLPGALLSNTIGASHTVSVDAPPLPDPVPAAAAMSAVSAHPDTHPALAICCGMTARSSSARHVAYPSRFCTAWKGIQLWMNSAAQDAEHVPALVVPPLLLTVYVQSADVVT